MNESTKAYEHYQKMISMPGKFSIEFHNFSKYDNVTLEGAKHNWDTEKGVGTAELQTKSGRILFDFTQVKKIK